MNLFFELLVLSESRRLSFNHDLLTVETRGMNGIISMVRVVRTCCTWIESNPMANDKTKENNYFFHAIHFHFHYYSIHRVVGHS